MVSTFVEGEDARFFISFYIIAEVKFEKQNQKLYQKKLENLYKGTSSVSPLRDATLGELEDICNIDKHRESGGRL